MKKRMVAAIICLSLGILFGGIGLYKYMEEKQAGTEASDRDFAGGKAGRAFRSRHSH